MNIIPGLSWEDLDIDKNCLGLKMTDEHTGIAIYSDQIIMQVFTWVDPYHADEIPDAAFKVSYDTGPVLSLNYIYIVLFH